MEKQLKALKEFQKYYPESAIGGSIGLALHGINLKRSLSNSDLDLINNEYLPDELPNSSMEWSSNRNDFDHVIYFGDRDSNTVTIDIRVVREYKSVIVTYKDTDYRVQLLEDIMFWKDKYARRKVKKHIDDIETIKTGIRPVDLSFNDDLPW